MEVLGAVAAIVLLLILCAESSSKKGGYKKGDLRISRGQDGTYYVYEKNTGLVLFEGTKDACARKIEDLLVK